MNRRRWMLAGLGTCWGLVTGLGCRGHQYGHVMKDSQQDMVGSHAAGAETFNPLIDEAVAKLLARQEVVFQQVSTGELPPPLTPKSICFVSVENKSSEELGDFRDQIYEQIDAMILSSQKYRPVSRRYVDAALRETRLRPDSLMIPENMRMFAAVLEQQGQPFDYMLYATLTSGTTADNADVQRDYMLTLELVNIHTGDYDKESAKIRKGYHKTMLGKLRQWGWK
ncbi:MAG: penicillin-binding protein activator LpoB [Pirellulaceae bacterium]